MQIAKSQSAYEYIKEIILTGELSPRIDISEKQLQQELGIDSDSVIRTMRKTWAPLEDAMKGIIEEKEENK